MPCRCEPSCLDDRTYSGIVCRLVRMADGARWSELKEAARETAIECRPRGVTWPVRRSWKLLCRTDSELDDELR